MSAAEPNSQLVSWKIFQNTLVSDRGSRHTLYSHFPFPYAPTPRCLQSDFVTAILQMLTKKVDSVSSELTFRFEQKIIEERSQYPLSTNINEYLQQLIAFLLTTPDSASAIFNANRIGEILALLQHFPSYANIDRNEAVSAFIALRNVTTHYAEQDKDGCHEELLMTKQFDSLIWHIRGLKTFLDT